MNSISNPFSAGMNNLPEMLKPGDNLRNTLNITADKSLFSLWSCFIPSLRQVDLNHSLWQEIGYASPLLPYSYMFNLTLSLGVFGFAEHSTRHMSCEDIMYCRPAYSGDTLHCEIIILGIKEIEGSDEIEIRSLHLLKNQNQKTVFKLVRNTAFPNTIKYETGDVDLESSTIENTALLCNIISNCKLLENKPYSTNKVDEQEFYVHRMVRGMAHCENAFFNTLLKNMHPHNINPLSRKSGVHLPEGYVLAIALGITNPEFMEFLCPEVEKALQIREVQCDSPMGGFSFIMGKDPFDDETEEVFVRTFCTADVNPEDLKNIEFPSELSITIDSKEDFESMVDKIIPQLKDKIVLVVDWKFYRYI
ncbi:MAG: hypothetical protein ACEPOV_10435 [Hyphomicrobiales bacterium]